MDCEERGRQPVFVEVDGRHAHAPHWNQGVCLGNRYPWRSNAARRDDIARFIEEGDLAKLADIDDVVLENLLPLRSLKPGIFEGRGERLQDLGVCRNVSADLLRGAGGDVAVAGDDRGAGAALQR